MRIVQVANFVTPTSGGLRTTLRHLAEGYARHGHEVVQVIPGATEGVDELPWGRVIRLPSMPVPGTGYRVLTHVARVEDLLAQLAPDRLEVHDRTTLRGLGRWAARHGVRSLVVSHERLDRWVEQWVPPRISLRRAADRSNSALARSFDTVLCTTAWAAEEFTRTGTPNLRVVPLGVDLEAFPPRLSVRADGPVRLVAATRLSKEKRPDLAVECVRELTRRGLPVRLVLAGDGPMRGPVERTARGLPIELPGFVRDRRELAALMRAADVFLAPGPVETFGLAALEALACGTPAVVNRHSALPDVVGCGGRASASSAFVFADAVEELLAVPEGERRRAARDRAETFRWDATIAGFLEAHEVSDQRVLVP